MEYVGGGELNELFSTKMCSPVVIYIAVLIVTFLNVYITRSTLKRYNTAKMDNLYNYYSMHELKLALITGIVMYGLCQYNKETLAWTFLIFPVIYVMLQNLIIHIYLAAAYQNAPKEMAVDGPSYSGAAQVVPQLSPQKSTNVPPTMSAETPISQAIGQSTSSSSMLGPAPSLSGGGDNFNIF
jgi:hypothetical protein